MVSEGGHKVERATSVKPRCAFLFDLGRIGHVKDRQLGAIVLFDIEKRSAVAYFMKQHRLASHSRQFGKLRWRHENDFVGRMLPRLCSTGQCEGRCSREGELSNSDDLFY